MSMILDGTSGLTLPAAAAPAFSVYLSANQTVTTTVVTKVSLNTKTFDTNTNFDASTNYRFTPTVAGYYQFNASIYGGASGGSQTLQVVYFYKNGSLYSTGSVQSSTTNVCGSGSVLISMNALPSFGVCEV